jgi:hypothetical protein
MAEPGPGSCPERSNENFRICVFLKIFKIGLGFGFESSEKCGQSVSAEFFLYCPGFRHKIFTFVKWMYY